MFTGIIKGRGIVKKFDIKTQNRSAAKMGIDLGNLAKGLQIGDSVAINGVCLTATHISKKQAEFEMIGETLKKTNLARRFVRSCQVPNGKRKTNTIEKTADERLPRIGNRTKSTTKGMAPTK